MIFVFSGLMLSPIAATSFCVLSVSSFMPYQEFSNRATSSAKSRSPSLSPLTHLILVSFTLITLVITHQGKGNRWQDTSSQHSCDDLKPFPHLSFIPHYTSTAIIEVLYSNNNNSGPTMRQWLTALTVEHRTNMDFKTIMTIIAWMYEYLQKVNV